MKTMIHAALSSTFVLTAVLLGGCVAPDGAAGETDMDSDVVDSDVEMDEDLATASSALSDSQGLRSYSETQQNKPAISVDRGVGTIPSVCPSGQVEILGACRPSGVAASCPLLPP
ncbi:MAG: hypothetical protein R3B70_40400 [Polyangiaceae bacterium]